MRTSCSRFTMATRLAHACSPASANKPASRPMTYSRRPCNSRLARSGKIRLSTGHVGSGQTKASNRILWRVAGCPSNRRRHHELRHHRHALPIRGVAARELTARADERRHLDALMADHLLGFQFAIRASACRGVAGSLGRFCWDRSGAFKCASRDRWHGDAARLPKVPRHAVTGQGLGYICVDPLAPSEERCEPRWRQKHLSGR